MGNKFSKIPKHAIEIWLIFNSIAQILGGGGQLGPPKLNGSFWTPKPDRFNRPNAPKRICLDCLQDYFCSHLTTPKTTKKLPLIDFG